MSFGARRVGAVWERRIPKAGTDEIGVSEGHIQGMLAGPVR
jgi:hypothetical protein